MPPKGIRPEGVRKYIRKSLEALQLDYLDVYLVHTPFGFKDEEGKNIPGTNDAPVELDVTTDIVAVWKATTD